MVEVSFQKNKTKVGKENMTEDLTKPYSEHSFVIYYKKKRNVTVHVPTVCHINQICLLSSLSVSSLSSLFLNSDL